MIKVRYTVFLCVVVLTESCFFLTHTHTHIYILYHSKAVSRVSFRTRLVSFVSSPVSNDDKPLPP